MSDPATLKAATASAVTATVATAAATVATARATTVTTAMVAIHWDGAQRVVIKTAWMMPTRKQDDAHRDTCQDHLTQIGSIKKGTPHGTSYYEIFMLCFLHTACYVPGNSRRRHMASGQHNRRNIGAKKTVRSATALCVTHGARTRSSATIASYPSITSHRGRTTRLPLPRLGGSKTKDTI